MHLVAADVDPHVVHAGHHVWIARQSQPGNIEQRRQALIRLLDVYMLEVNDIADIFSGSIEKGFHVFARQNSVNRNFERDTPETVLLSKDPPTTELYVSSQERMLDVRGGRRPAARLLEFDGIASAHDRNVS